jgi:hypothetical protein
VHAVGLDQPKRITDQHSVDERTGSISDQVIASIVAYLGRPDRGDLTLGSTGGPTELVRVVVVILAHPDRHKLILVARQRVAAPVQVVTPTKVAARTIVH